jgi:hypothetical protein
MGDSGAGAASIVKGLAFLSVMRAVTKLRGTKQTEQALSRMSQEVSDGLRHGSIVASGWYPVAWYCDMWRGIRDSTGEGVGFARTIGRESFRQDLNLVHKFALSLLSPETVMSIGTRLTAKYYRPARVSFELHSGVAHAYYSDCHGWDENMWAEIAAGIELMLELSGAKRIRIRLVEGGRAQDDSAIFEGQWA